MATVNFVGSQLPELSKRNPLGVASFQHHMAEQEEDCEVGGVFKIVERSNPLSKPPGRTANCSSAP
jgi:hypothetical protein